MTTYVLSEIPDIDPAEFTVYASGKRQFLYFHQVISCEILDIGSTPGWIPVGKTNNKKILAGSDEPCDIAVMYQWESVSEERIWFHLSRS